MGETEVPALSLEEEAEDVWAEGPLPGDALPETEMPPPAFEAPPRFEAAPAPRHAPEPRREPRREPPPRPAAPAARAAPAPEPARAPESAAAARKELLGPKTASLLEYLEGLSGALPRDKLAEFESSGLKAKMDSLIERLKTGPGSRLAARPAPPPIGLLAAGEASRKTDPRRSPQGRRSGLERRAEDNRRAAKDRRQRGERRGIAERRERSDRRSGDRRAPPPRLDLPPTIPPGAAPVVVAPDGMPSEIAGIPVSPRLARLIEIMRREKEEHGRE